VVMRETVKLETQGGNRVENAVPGAPNAKILVN